jgi:transcriptional regulator with XRE-family HTH domain
MGRTYETASYRELGAAMRKLRTAAGLTARQIGTKTGWDPAQISRIESGKVRVDATKLCWYLGILRVPHDVAVPLIDLCHKAKAASGFWLDPRLRARLSTLIYHESTANGSISFESEVVPGLLQTERYARAIMNKPGKSDVDLNASVSTRMERQKLLKRRGSRQRFLPTSAGANSVCGGAFGLFDFDSFQPLGMFGTLAADFWPDGMSVVRPCSELIPDLA